MHLGKILMVSDPRMSGGIDSKWLAGEPARFALSNRAEKEAGQLAYIARLIRRKPTVNSLTSDLPVVLDSGANSPGRNAHASKGIADISG